MTLRDDAIKFVQEGITTGKWSTWGDCQKLITEHDQEDDPVPEGMEAYGFDPYDGPDPPPFDGGDDGDKEDDAEDVADKEDEAGADGDVAAGDGGGPDGDGDSTEHSDTDEDTEDEAGDHGGDDKGKGGAAGAAHAKVIPAVGSTPVHSQEVGVLSEKVAPPSEDVTAALYLIYKKSMQDGDNRMMTVMRQTIHEIKKTKAEASTEVALALGKRVQEHEIANAKRFRELAEVEHQGVLDIIEGQNEKEKNKREAAKFQADKQQQMVDEQKRKRQRIVENKLVETKDEWLQTQFSAILFRQVQAFYRSKPPYQKTFFQASLERARRGNVFKTIIIPQVLWESKHKYAMHWCQTKDFVSTTHHRIVRCSERLWQIIDKVLSSDLQGPHNASTKVNEAATAMTALLVECIGPMAREIFTGMMHPKRMLHANDYSLDKTFVYAIVLLSKYLGPETYPCGVYDVWPPTMPATEDTKTDFPPSVEPMHRTSVAASSKRP